MSKEAEIRCEYLLEMLDVPFGGLDFSIPFHPLTKSFFFFFRKSACGWITIVAKWPQNNVVQISDLQPDGLNLQSSFKVRWKNLKKNFKNGIIIVILTPNDHWRYFSLRHFSGGFKKSFFAILHYFLKIRKKFFSRNVSLKSM